MNERRKQIEGRLGYRLYDCVWERAVKDHRDGDEQILEEVLEDLQQFAETVVEEHEAQPPAKPRKSVEPVDKTRSFNEDKSNALQILVEHSFSLDSDARAALQALSAYAALKANEDQRVTEFRARALGSEYLSTVQATDLLSSYAARFLTLEQLQDFNVPLAGHEALLVGPYRENVRGGFFEHIVTLKIVPPDISLKLRYTNGSQQSGDASELIRREVEGGEVVYPYKASLPSEEMTGTEPADIEGDQNSQYVGTFLVSGFDTADRPADIWPGSLVDEIYGLAQELSESFMWPSRSTRSGRVGTWWNVDSAALFVLTGIAPLMHPVRVGFGCAGGSLDIPSRVGFEVLPWLPPETVFEFYKSVREALKVNLRNQGARKFEVVTFVLGRSKSCGPKALDFRQLREDWNETFPNVKFRDTSEFKTNFERGLKAVKQRYYS